jgi:hypothetical protein
MIPICKYSASDNMLLPKLPNGEPSVSETKIDRHEHRKH